MKNNQLEKEKSVFRQLPSKHQRHRYFQMGYGWVVKVDPFDPTFTPKKSTAFGRFSQENTAMVIAPTGQLVVYMGDDANDQYVLQIRQFAQASIFFPCRQAV
jgi:secreted PhoX family phosphatase